jgi:hypothetical protein
MTERSHEGAETFADDSMGAAIVAGAAAVVGTLALIPARKRKKISADFVSDVERAGAPEAVVKTLREAESAVAGSAQ